MPDLNTEIHLSMLRKFQRQRSFLPRLLQAIKREWASANIYGLHWGDPDVVEPLKFIRDRYVLPYVKADQVAVEIGPGGGRWTRYLLGFRKLYVVDYYREVLDELKRNFHRRNMVFIGNGGTDFPGVDECSIDYVFSFGTFVHLDLDLIEAYLMNLKPILRPGSNVVIQYSDKTKIIARQKPGFSENTPATMRRLVMRAGYRILEEDLTTLWHSSVVRLAP